MKKNVVVFILPFIVFLSFSCKLMMVGDIAENTPESIFEVLWNDYDQMYGLFIARNIDWDTAYSTYKPMVTSDITDEELFTVFSDMLDLLDDSHVSLYTDNPNWIYHGGRHGQLGFNDNFSQDLIMDDYLTDVHSYQTEGGYYDFYGKLSNNIGYLHLAHMGHDENEIEEIMDNFIDDMDGLDGVIVDVRNNYGGNDSETNYVSGRFASERKLYMTTRFRNGPEHDDFESAQYWYVEPTGTGQFTGPVVLLTDRWTLSAGETFTMAMRRNSNVTHIGDTTCGAFSNTTRRELPNCWMYIISNGDYRDADNISYEGTGITPEIYSVTTEADIAAGDDPALERCIVFLTSGN